MESSHRHIESWNRWIKIVESSQQNRGIVASESYNRRSKIVESSYRNREIYSSLYGSNRGIIVY